MTAKARRLTLCPVLKSPLSVSLTRIALVVSMVALAALPGSPPQVEAWLGLLEKGVSAAGGPVECLKPQAAEHSRQVSGTGVGQIRLVAQTAAVGESDTQNSRGLRLHTALQMTESLCFQQVPSCNSSKECRGQRALDILVAAKVLLCRLWRRGEARIVKTLTCDLRCSGTAVEGIPRLVTGTAVRTARPPVQHPLCPDSLLWQSG